MRKFASIIKLFRWLVLVAMIAAALSLVSCRTPRSAPISQAKLSLQEFTQPKLMTKHTQWPLPSLNIIKQESGVQVSHVDSVSGLVLTAKLSEGGTLIIDAFSFQPEPFHLDGLELSSSATQQEEPEQPPWGKLFCWFGVLVCLVVLFRK